jgi:hypothetical protein
VPDRISQQATLAAAALLAGESEALTRRAVELALAGDPTAIAALPRAHPVASPRTHGKIRIAVDRERPHGTKPVG